LSTSEDAARFTRGFESRAIGMQLEELSCSAGALVWGRILSIRSVLVQSVFSRCCQCCVVLFISSRSSVSSAAPLPNLT
jgi:hypothetical protein